MKGTGGTKMKQGREDFKSMKKDDDRYGEGLKKTQTVKDHNKKDKYVKNYQKMRVEDLSDDEDDDYDFDDGYKPLDEN